MEEQVRGVLFEGQVADLVDDDQSVAAQPGQFVGESAGAVGVGEAGDPLGRGREQHPVAVVGGGDAEAGGEVGLAGAGRAEQDDVAGFGQERRRRPTRRPVGARRVGRPSRTPRSSCGAANPAARIRSWAPEALRAATSRSRTAARYSSWVQPASRAWSASRAAASVIRGAFNAEAR